MRSFLFGFFSASVQSVTQPCLTLCDPMDHSTLGLPVHHQLPDFTQTHIHSVGDAIQPSHPLLSLSPPAFNFSQHQGHCHLFPPRNPSLCLFFGCFLGFQAVGSSFIHCFSSVCVCVCVCVCFFSNLFPDCKGILTALSLTLASGPAYVFHTTDMELIPKQQYFQIILFKSLALIPIPYVK